MTLGRPRPAAAPGAASGRGPGRAASARGSGSSMHAGAPGAACSKEFSSGSISSQPARRPCTRGAAWLKSGDQERVGQLGGRTDCGSTSARRTPFATRARARRLRLRLDARPAACISRSSRRVPSEISASSCEQVKSDGSRAAIWARIVATPSSRLSWVSRCCSGQRRRRRGRRARSAARQQGRRPGSARAAPRSAAVSSTARSTSRTASRAPG